MCILFNIATLMVDARELRPRRQGVSLSVIKQRSLYTSKKSKQTLLKTLYFPSVQLDKATILLSMGIN